MAESRGALAATGYNKNGTVDRGLMQINSIHADMVQDNLLSLYQPDVNMRVAHNLWQGKGWTPWATYDSGVYRQYL